MLPQGYTKEELKREEKIYVMGMEHLRDEIDTIAANFDLDEDSIIDKIKGEVVEEFVEHLKNYVQSEIDSVIISAIDNHEEEE